ncbi:zinc finger protein 721-like [Cydia splendana]|uniref:zinc finger protein 721-like n=1 Tax=Cydia splendana TaxID=1100963 RepID=UPI00300CF6A1
MDITPNGSSNRDSLLCCRACLSTERRLFSIHESKLTDAFSHISGTPVYQDYFPQFLCTFCRAVLIKSASFREMCLRTQQTLTAEPYKQALNTECIRSIPSHSIYNLTITQLEPQECPDSPVLPDIDIKVEPNIDIVDIDSIIKNDLKVELEKEEINDKDKDIIFVKDVETVKKKKKRSTCKKNNKLENDYDELDDIDDDSIVSNVSLEDKKEVYEEMEYDDDVYRKNSKSKVKKKGRKVKKAVAVKNNKNKVVHPKEATKKTGAKYPRDPTNDMPLFDFDKFEKTHAVQIVTLSKEEQLEEIASRKKSRNYLESRFRCEDCGKGFDAEAAYNNHLLRHSPSMGQHPCEICSVRFKLKCRRQQHQDLHRLKFLCKECSFVSRTRSQAKRHHAMHAGKTYECQHCGKTFKMSSTYLTHVRRAHAALNVACEVCGETFVGEKGLKLHKKRTHSENMPLRLKCGICSANFYSVEALNRHTDTAGEHRDLRPCEQCGENCASEEALHKHVGEMHPSELRRCEECGLTFPSAASYDTHHRRKHLQRYKDGRNVQRKRRVPRAPPPRGQFVCEQCGRILPDGPNVQRKRRVPRVPPPRGQFVCEQCGRILPRYKDGRNVQRKRRVPRAPPPRGQFVCEQCGRILPRYKDGRNVQRKRRVPRAPPPRGQFVCEQCGRILPRYMDGRNVERKRRVSRAPPPRGQFVCEQCGRILPRYKDGRNVQRKRRVPRAPPPRGQFVCEQCGRILPRYKDGRNVQRKRRVPRAPSPRGQFVCEQCGRILPRYKDGRNVQRKRRVPRAPSPRGQFVCEQCGRILPRYKDGRYVQRKRRVPRAPSPRGQLVCEQCGRILPRYKDGRNVQRKRRVSRAPPPRGQFVCEQCGRILPVCTVSLYQPAALQGRAERSAKRRVPRAPPPRGQFVCEQCGRILPRYKDGRNVQRKRRVSRAPPPRGQFVCEQCGRILPVCTVSLYQPAALQGRAERSAKRRVPRAPPPRGQFVCEQCGRILPRYKDGRNVQRKRRVSRAPPPRGQFVCEQCGRILPVCTVSLYQPAALQGRPERSAQAPRRPHEELRPASPLAANLSTRTGDSVCGETPMRNATLLRYHQRTHQDVKPYACTECPKTFALKSSLNVSIQTHFSAYGK